MPRLLLASVTLLVVLALAPSASAYSAPRAAHAEAAKERRGLVFVRHSLGDGKLFVRPHRFYLSADGAFSLWGIHWRSWGGRAALGKGHAYANDCIPFCLGGTYHEPVAKVRLSRIVECNGRRVYSRLRIRLKGYVPDNIPRRHFIAIDPWYC